MLYSVTIVIALVYVILFGEIRAAATGCRLAVRNVVAL